MNDQTNTSAQTTETEKSVVSTLKSKFSSRKFLLSLVGVITGICGIIGCNDNTVAVVTFVVLEILSIVSYLICEGKIDAAAVGKGLNIAQEIMKVIESFKGSGKGDIPDHAIGTDYIDTLPQSDAAPIEDKSPDSVSQTTTTSTDDI